MPLMCKKSADLDASAIERADHPPVADARDERVQSIRTNRPTVGLHQEEMRVAVIAQRHTSGRAHEEQLPPHEGITGRIDVFVRREIRREVTNASEAFVLIVQLSDVRVQRDRIYLHSF